MDSVGVDPACYDLLPDGLLVADADGRVAVVNDAALRLLGCTRADLLGRSLAAALPLSDVAGRDWWACTRPYDGLLTRTGQPERRLLLPDGRALLVTARYVRDKPLGPVTAVAVALRDTAARRREERDQAELVSTVAHELRSPLTSVKGFTATLLRRWDKFPDDTKKVMLETVNADADRVTRLIGELLDVSRIDAGRLELHRQIIDLPAIVERVVSGRVASGEAEDRFSVRIDDELPELWADPDKVEQVVANLVENALRHGGGRVTVALSTEALSDAGEPAVVLTVEDEGPGVPEEHIGRIFGKFWRVQRGRGGTGLGLFVAKGIVDAHGGRIEVGRSAAGGAQFRVLLPAGEPPEVAAYTPAP